MNEVPGKKGTLSKLAVLKLQKVGKKMPAIATAVAAVQRVNVFVLS